MKKRLAYLGIFEGSTFTSCKKIEHSLVDFYQSNDQDEFKSFSFSLNAPETWNELINEIILYKPDTIIFGDSRIKLPFWIERILKGLDKNCRWIIHTFGCFLTRQDEIFLVSKLLQHQEFIIITASEAHLKILQSFFMPHEAVVKIPFSLPVILPPTNTGISFREKYDLGRKKVFLSASRISHHKNIPQLIDLFEHYHESNPESALMIAGGFDDQAEWDLNLKSELFQSSFRRLKENNIPIFYLGQLDQNQLYQCMIEADALISLSTNIGEDFGLVIHEAMSLGLPCLLSSWGGHRDFASDPLVKLIPLEIEGSEIRIDDTKLFQQMNDITQLKRTQRETQNFHSELRQVLAKPFPKHLGMSSSFKTYAKHLSLRAFPEIKPFFQEFEAYVYPYWR